MQSYNILDEASGAVVGTQTWPDAFAPVLGSGQSSTPVNISVNNVSGTFDATGTGASITIKGDFNVCLSGTFAAIIVLERSFDGGVTWIPAAFADGSIPAFAGALSGTWSEHENGVRYRLRCSDYTSGTINWRISQ